MTEISTPPLLAQTCLQLRRLVLEATTRAGSGHPSSCLSAVELMAVLMFKGYFKADFKNPEKVTNDRLIFSKGHAAPLLYALYAVLGAIDEKELLTLRQLGSRLEGHPTMQFPYTEAATGSLGQGLSIGVGIALAAKLDKQSYQTYVLLGDGELTEGANWEAAAIAKHYHLNNLTVILDINRYEQVGLTMDQWETSLFAQKFRAFGWAPVLVKDGHNLEEVSNAFSYCEKLQEQAPKVILAQTIKGKGVSLFENQPGWHGKVLSEEELATALKELAGENKPDLQKTTKELESVLSKLSKLQNE